MSSTTRMAFADAAFGAPASIRSDIMVVAAMAVDRPPLRPSVLRGTVRPCARPARTPPPYSIPPQRGHEGSGEIMSLLARASPVLRLHRTTGAPAPVLPGPVDAVGAGALGDLIDLAAVQVLDLAHVHGLFLQPRVHLEIDRDIDRVPDVPARDGCTMTAHQRGAAGPDQLGQVAAHLHVLDQQGGIAEMVVRVPDRHLMADRGPHVKDRPDLRGR